eukprot:2374900-Pleurochrysis_carterae.AAC.1
MLDAAHARADYFHLDALAASGVTIDDDVHAAIYRSGDALRAAATRHDAEIAADAADSGSDSG